MKFKGGFFGNYICEAPLALAIERALECEILAKQSFERPILDLGCGEGIFASVLFDEPVDTGIDINLNELVAARRYSNHIELIYCSADNIPKPDSYYSTIFSNSVLEHIPNIEQVLKESERLLTPSGHLYVTLPTNYFEQYSIGNIILSGLGLSHTAQRFRVFYNKIWNHFHCYSVSDWKLLFECAGFEVHQTIIYCPKKIAALNDLLTWPALFSFIVKKIIKRWFIFRKLRRILSPLYVKIIRIDFSVDKNIKEGGLVFFDLVKKYEGKYK
ncbi:MAG: class I SAM-dependent methyltransferase [Candidatus Hodarchaeales archaeon]|jgi:SAM-dependent methyltransferase